MIFKVLPAMFSFSQGTPPEIHEHIQQKNCVGKGVTDLLFLAQQLIQLFQQIEGLEGKKLDKKVR